MKLVMLAHPPNPKPTTNTHPTTNMFTAYIPVQLGRKNGGFSAAFCTIKCIMRITAFIYKYVPNFSLLDCLRLLRAGLIIAVDLDVVCFHLWSLNLDSWPIQNFRGNLYLSLNMNLDCKNEIHPFRLLSNKEHTDISDSLLLCGSEEDRKIPNSGCFCL